LQFAQAGEDLGGYFGIEGVVASPAPGLIQPALSVGYLFDHLLDTVGLLHENLGNFAELLIVNMEIVPISHVRHSFLWCDLG
jgi:hypothetical protein